MFYTNYSFKKLYIDIMQTLLCRFLTSLVEYTRKMSRGVAILIPLKKPDVKDRHLFCTWYGREASRRFSSTRSV